MAYLDQSRSPSASSMVAVVAVHAAIAALLVTGLTVTGVIAEEDGPLTTITPYKKPPPPPEDKVEPKASQAEQTTITVPTPDFELKPIEPTFKTTDLILPPRPKPNPGLGTEILPKPTPSATAKFAPVGAKPRNDPGGWLSDADYKSSWVRLELVGTARFRLEIAATGKVTGCEVTGSTGHKELDTATCALVSRRARFEPARGGEGEPVTGAYSGSVRWQLPE